MDYNQIKLENERNSHVTKRLNRLSGWQFFKVLYRNDFLKILLINILMLVFLAPTVVIYYLNQVEIANIMARLPYSNVFGVGTSVWLDTANVLSSSVLEANNTMHLWAMLTLLGFAFIFSGGFAAIRDSFWTGKLVVFKPFFKGIATNIPYTLGGTAILSAMYYGVFTLQTYLLNFTAVPVWVSIIIIVIAYLALAFVGMYMFTLFAVTVTYKQSFAQNLKDSWLLLFMNILPNILRFIITIVPFGLLIIMSSTQILQALIVVFFLMFGIFYIVFNWMVHMMKTFALFHPVAKKADAQAKNSNEKLPTPAKA